MLFIREKHYFDQTGKINLNVFKFQNFVEKILQRKNIQNDDDHFSTVQLKGVMRMTGHLSPSKLCRFLASSALSGKFFA